MASELVDEAEIVVGERVLKPEWAGAAVGQVGVTALRLRLPADLSPGALPLTARSAGKPSNPVTLPVQ
jgi:uncharacterized protein (TIGR03437 family)